MTRIDRYILFLFLRVVAICFCCLVGLLIIVHAFTNLDEFIAFGKARGSMFKALVEYYGPYSIALADRFGATLALMSIMFVVSWLKRTNELTSMMAAGISPRRILIWPLIASVCLFSLLAVSRELVIPQYEEMLGKNPQDLIDSTTRAIKPTYDGKNGILIGGRSMTLASKLITDPIFRVDGPASSVTKQIIASQAVYETANEQHPAGFLFKGIRVPAGLANVSSVKQADDPTISFLLTPKDNPWLAPDQCFLMSDIEFGDLRGGGNWRQYASTLDMIERLRSPASHYGDDLRVSVHSRLVQPIMDLTLLLVGLPIVLKRQDRHLFWIAGVMMVIIGGFMGVTMAIRGLAGSGLGLTPFWGAWLPVLVFAPWAWAKAKSALNT